jgi:hypothetical protein
MSVTRCMIIAAAIADQARAIGALFGPGAAGMWTTALSADGALPATHYISSGCIAPEFASMLETPEALQAGAALLAVALDLPTCAALLAGADVSDEEPFAVMERLGLQMVQEPS